MTIESPLHSTSTFQEDLGAKSGPEPSSTIHSPSTDFAMHIANAHISGMWTWEHAHDPRWRLLFYEHLLQQSHNATPLTDSEAKEYESQLVTSLPTEGFFPHPHIAYKNLALLRTHTRAHQPLPPRLRGTSKLCVPHENYATARTDLTRGTLLGFHMGWVVSASQPSAPFHTFRLQTPREKCDVSGWDNDITATLRQQIFSVSHINEYIWDDDDTNPNNLR
jgi:hypothetical protein